MGLDAWGVKLKEGVNPKYADWNDLEDISYKELLSDTNYFKENVYGKIHYEFVKDNIKTRFNSAETWNPCCSYETMNNVAKELKEFVKIIDKNYKYVYRDMKGFVQTYVHSDYLDYKAVKDLVEYINVLNDNGFVMWFSW